MPKPTPEQIKSALVAAEKLREDKDEDSLGHYLLYLHDRNQHLESVYEQVTHYLHSGQAAREHSLLVRTIEEAERAAHPHEDAPAVFPGD
ncbi:MAG TPA: hypothetical protein PLF22_12630 [Pseudomonadales bacterium]|nr:hypothetical protein [Pseudomonadales bacterium]